MTERTGAKGRTFYQYDLQGNLTGESGSERGRYYYNPFNQQTKAERSDGYIQENLYDGEGLRAGINNLESSAWFVFYNGELLIETKEEGGIRSRYVLGYGVAASEVNGEAGYHAYHLDEQNSTVYITGNQRQVENSYAYDAFGNLRGQAGELFNRILYTGQQYDQEMGQYYLRARYYNPVLGRFQQEDPYRGDGLNRYAYCANNPVNYYDPNGYGGENNCGGKDKTEDVNNEGMGKGTGVPGTEEFYRTMSEKEYAKLLENEALTKRDKGAGELKVTQSEEYTTTDLSERNNQGKKYTEVVQFEVTEGTADSLKNMGATLSYTSSDFPDLPSIDSSEGKGKVEIKYESI